MKFISCLVLFLFLIACKSTSSISDKDSNLLFSIEKGPCFGTCPQYKVEVYADGNAYYYGHQNVDKIGEYKVYLPASLLKQMKEELAQSNLATLDTAYVNKFLTDFPAIDLYFDLKQGRKHIHIFHEQPPSEIDRLLHLIDGFEQSINWKNTN